MKLSKRILASVASLAVAATMLSATYASAADVAYEAPSISTAPEFRKNGIDLKANEVYSTLKELPTQPTVGVSVQMGASYCFRNAFSAPSTETTTTSFIPNADGTDTDKFKLTIKSSTWSAFFVHAAQVAYTADGIELVNKKGSAPSPIAVAQPGGDNIYKDAKGNEVVVTDTNNIPDGVVQYFKEAELVDATIKGAGTYKAAIVGHDFQNDGDMPGFNWLMLTSNVGYYDGLVSNQAYTVSADALNKTVKEAKDFLETLKAQLEDLKDIAAEEPSEDPTEEPSEEPSEDPTEESSEEPSEEPTEAENDDIQAEIEELETNIANLESAIATAEAAAKNAGKTLAKDYHLKISSMKVNGYNSANAYTSGKPDMTYNVPVFTTGTSGGADDYNFSEYNAVNVYSKDKGYIDYTATSTIDEDGNHSGYITGTYKGDTTDGSFDAIGASVRATDNGATAALPTYALEVEFTIADGDADVFGYQGAIDDAQTAVATAVQEAGGLVWSNLNDAIAKAEAVDSSKYTTTSYEALMAAVQAGKDLIAKYENGEDVTQEEIDAATAAITEAYDALEPVAIDEPTPTEDPSNDDTKTPTDGSGNDSNGSGSATDSNPSTGAGLAVTGAMALLVGAGFTISRKRK